MDELVKKEKVVEGEVVWSPAKTKSAKIKPLIPEAEVYELDPDKKYVIVVRKEILAMDAVEHLCQILKAMGIAAAVMSYRGGPIKDGIQVMEQE